MTAILSCLIHRSAESSAPLRGFLRTKVIAARVNPIGGGGIKGV
jgi:hypothetical protein